MDYSKIGLDNFLQKTNTAISGIRQYVSGLDFDSFNDQNIISSKFVQNGAITTGKIGDLAITSTQIADDSISTPKLQANSVTTNIIATNAVTANEINANAVTAAKISVSNLSAINANMGTLTAGLINGGTINASNANIININANNINSGTIVGLKIKTSTSGRRVELSDSTNSVSFYNESGNNAGLLFGDDSYGMFVTSQNGQDLTLASDSGTIIFLDHLGIGGNITNTGTAISNYSSVINNLAVGGNITAVGTLVMGDNINLGANGIINGGEASFGAVSVTTLTTSSWISAGGDLDMNSNDIDDVASIDGGGNDVKFDDSIDMNGNNINDCNAINVDYIDVRDESKVQVNDDLYVTGALSKGSGSFDIPHPDPKKKEFRLRHYMVETNTPGDNIYRYKVKVEDGKAVVDLPDYSKYLNGNIQAWVTPVDSFGIAKAECVKEKVNIEATIDGEYNVLVIGTRIDEVGLKYWDRYGLEYKGDVVSKKVIKEIKEKRLLGKKIELEKVAKTK